MKGHTFVIGDFRNGGGDGHHAQPPDSSPCRALPTPGRRNATGWRARVWGSGGPGDFVLGSYCGSPTH